MPLPKLVYMANQIGRFFVTEDRKTAVAHVAAWAAANVEEIDREFFRDVAESELLALHEGNFARYALRPAEFAAWGDVWNARA